MPAPLHTFLTIFFGFVDIIELYRLSTIKLGYRFSQKLHPFTFLLTGAFYMLTSYSSELFPDIPIKMLFFFLHFITLFIICKGTTYKKIFWNIMGFFIISAVELLTTPFIILFTRQTNMFALMADPVIHVTELFISRALIVLIIEALLRSSKKLYDGLAKDFFPIMLVNIIYIFLQVSLFYVEGIFISVESAILLSLLSMILITILVLLLLRKIAKKSDEIMVTNLKMQQMEMEYKQNQDMAHIAENLRSLRHDMNNHMSVLQGLLSMGEVADAQRYLETITKDLAVANNFIFTENKILSVLLNNKISKATEQSIDFEIELLTNTTPFMDDELCAVLGNLLENAIEAASGHDNPYIYFSMKKSDGQLLIQCDNTYTTAPIFENGHLVTTKADKSYHGIGTKTIRSIIDRYKGTTTFTVDDLFHANITVPLS